MTWLHALALGEIFQNEMVAVRVAGRPILLVHLDDGVRAYDDRCAHQGHALSRGALEGCVLRCPVHGWTFDVRDGCSVNPRAASLAAHAVRLVDGSIFVELDIDEQGVE
jgi:3-phenylpropionate/trans-cinnamate dioxygenase ferredoxin subunit